MSDGVVHALALIAGIVGFSMLIPHVAAERTTGELTAVIVYAIGFFSMISFSFAYNMWPMTSVKWALRRFDHSAIFLMIAGTCTAFLSQLHSPWWAGSLMAAIWAGALGGIAMKVFMPGRFERAALALYLSLGWICLIGIVPIVRALEPQTLALVVLGGAIYTSGVFFYRWDDLRYHNTIWHGFVVTAAGVHFAGVALAVA
ncbi:hemolysin III family protein [Rhizobiaceae bacterium]|nr:hemolysin III family protein [Rhizobiaceae bacterium]